MKENNNQKNLLVRAYEKLLSILRNLPSLRKSTAMLYISIVAGLNAIAMIVITIFGALVWNSGLATVGMGFIVIVSALICIISINIWKNNRKKEREVRS